MQQTRKMRADELGEKLFQAGFTYDEDTDCIFIFGVGSVGTMHDADVKAWVTKGIGSAGMVVNRLSKICPGEDNNSEDWAKV